MRPKSLAAAPAGWANTATGCAARMQGAHGNSLGFAAPLLYRVYAASTPQQVSSGPPATELIGPFHDVLQGTNGLCFSKGRDGRRRPAVA
jgi:hypothetical protein